MKASLWLAVLEPFLLGVGFLIVFVANRWPPAASGAAIGVLCAAALRRRTWAPGQTANTPFHGAIRLIGLVFIPLSLYAAPAWNNTWPKVAGLCWALLLFDWIVARATSAAGGWSVKQLLFAHHATGVIAAMVCFFAMERRFFLQDWPRLSLRPLGHPDKLPPNEVAGVLVLFAAPLTVALLARLLGKAATPAERPASRIPRLCALTAAAGALWICVVVTESRGAMLGLAVAAGAILPGFGRRGWVTLGLLAAAGCGLILAVKDMPAFQRMFFGGTVQGFTIETLLTGRMDIWRSAILAFKDFMFTGIGLGAFGNALSLVYPHRDWASMIHLEDAHNWYLQNFLDFGLFGGAVMVLVLFIGGACAIELARSRHEVLTRHAGLCFLSALIAHLVYGMTDSVSMGTMGSISWWLTLAILAAVYAQDRAADRLNATEAALEGASASSRHLSLAERLGGSLDFAAARRFTRNPRGWDKADMARVAVLGCVLGTLAVGYERLRFNQACVRLHKAISVNTASVEIEAARARMAEFVKTRCAAYWWLGIAEKRLNRNRARDEAWVDLARCDERRVKSIRHMMPQDRMLAERVLAAAPNSGSASVWIADLTRHEDPARAVALYRAGVRSDPANGVAWLRLGDLLRQKEPKAALEAYIESCKNGDPGANSCVRAGALALELGDKVAAIRYYRMSNWPPARDLAERLERNE